MAQTSIPTRVSTTRPLPACSCSAVAQPTYHLNLAELILFNMAAAVLSGLNTQHEIVERYGTIPQDEQGSFDQAQRQRRRGLGIGLASTRGRVRLSEMFGRKEK
jgi:hypothetical protein